MGPGGEARRLASILVADVVGYSRLMAVDEAGTLAQLKAVRKELIEPKTAEHRGRVVKLMGDGILMEFASVVDAVAFAADVQRAMASRSAGVPQDLRITYRVGINIGDIMVDGDDIYGDGVNIAARLQGLAEPGEIFVAGNVFNQVKHKVDLGFDDLGERDLKNIPDPVRVYRMLTRAAPAKTISGTPSRARRWPAIAAGVAVLVAIAGAVAWLRPWVPEMKPVSVEQMAFELPDRPSIAVLPFTNMSDDPAQDYFADGMAEDLITDLSKISGLFVISRNSTFAYKKKVVDVKQVAQELGVKYVLEGSVRRVGDQVRINAQLIDATTGGHLWADRYDGSLNDVFGLQDKVTRKIVAVLAVQLTAGEQQQVARKETDNAEAYDTFLKGWERYLRQRPESFRQAIALFEKAAELDPKYSRAYAALAATYWQVWKRYWHNALGSSSWHDVRFKAEEFLAKSMEDPTPLALQVSAAMLAQQSRHDEAIAEGERAVAMDPNDADGYVALAGALNLAGKPEKALPLMERAMRLNPHYPTSYLYEFGLARFGMEEFDEAAVALERAVILNPDDRWTSRLMIATLGRLGRAGEAAAVIERAEANWRGFDPLSVRGITFWYPFKEPADAERFADGLRKAGIPD